MFEAANPALKSLPLGVQQKQIIVTCNYEARRRGLRKLQLIREAKEMCPELVVVNGENLSKFRDASKELYKFLESFTWNRKVERLGMDEVWLDVTDIVAYNEGMVRCGNGNAWLCLDRDDPMKGFGFDAGTIAGEKYPKSETNRMDVEGCPEPELVRRLLLASHLATHIRHKLEEEKGYTATVGISTNKLLSKLAGNMHKPKNQTTLMPPYSSRDGQEGNPQVFMDGHAIGKIPGIGFKLAQKLRNHILGVTADINDPSLYGDNKDPITVKDVRTYPGMGPQLLDRLLGGPGSEKRLGAKVWGLLNGIDDSEVQRAKRVPTQISIEDSYGRLETVSEVKKELLILTTSLIHRMHIDLFEDDDDDLAGKRKKWLAYPKTIRLSTRPRNIEGSISHNVYMSKRISRSAPLPGFVFSLKERVDAIVVKLVNETLMSMFRRLHGSKGWNLSLMNVCVTNMVETAGDDTPGRGRDIGRMFRHQEEALKAWRVEDRDVPPETPNTTMSMSEEARKLGEEKAYVAKGEDSILKAEPSAGGDATRGLSSSAASADMTEVDYEDGGEWFAEECDEGELCHICGAVMPSFAMAAHNRFHIVGTD